jgi:hypothetical protein
MERFDSGQVGSLKALRHSVVSAVRVKHMLPQRSRSASEHRFFVDPLALTRFLPIIPFLDSRWLDIQSVSC